MPRATHAAGTDNKGSERVSTWIKVEEAAQSSWLIVRKLKSQSQPCLHNFLLQALIWSGTQLAGSTWGQQGDLI